MILPEHIPPERVKEWHAFLATLSPAWWEGKTAKMLHDNNKMPAAALSYCRHQQNDVYYNGSMLHLCTDSVQLNGYLLHLVIAFHRLT